MSSASYLAAYAFTRFSLLVTESDSGKQSLLTATIPIFIFGMFSIVVIILSFLVYKS